MNHYILEQEEGAEIFETMNVDECDIDTGGALYLNLFYFALTSVFLLLSGTIISSMIISYYMFNVPTIGLEDKNDEDCDESSDDSDDDEMPYEHKYVNEFEELIASNLVMWSDQEKSNLSKLIIMDTTPNGDVVMSYEYDKDDEERSKFVYYSDSKTIPYKYLDTVARKFVYAHKCPNIYVFIRDELIKEMKRIEDEKIRQEERAKMGENETQNSKKTDNVFASFKNYKTSNSNNTSIKKRHILVTKNKYKHLGTIEDYNKSLLTSEEKKEVKPVSFSEFKKMNIYN
jgi:hypothetical protein